MAYVIETEKGKFAGCSTSELYGTGENGSIMQQISFDSFVTRWHVSLAVFYLAEFRAPWWGEVVPAVARADSKLILEIGSGIWIPEQNFHLVQRTAVNSIPIRIWNFKKKIGFSSPSPINRRVFCFLYLEKVANYCFFRCYLIVVSAALHSA